MLETPLYWSEVSGTTRVWVGLVPHQRLFETGAGSALWVNEADKAPPGFPSIAAPPTTMVVEVGHTATLPCQASGSPSPRIRWLWNSLPLDVASNPRYALLNDKMH
ncbi:jg19121, partial [Pararge aegeria aegeria]